MDGTGTRNRYWLADYPASYHNESGRFSFADGPVEGHRWLGPTLLTPLGQAHDPSYTSPTDQDVKWLQDHCTELKLRRQSKYDYLGLSRWAPPRRPSGGPGVLRRDARRRPA